MTFISSNDQVRRKELGEMLRIMRARISPTDVGLPTRVRSRTPGLRREDVAAAAGISITLYTWIEQGRDITVTPRVVDALARALRLTTVERTQLEHLASRSP